MDYYLRDSYRRYRVIRNFVDIGRNFVCLVSHMSATIQIIVVYDNESI